MTDQMAAQKYRELRAAVDERNKAAKYLETCEKRVSELLGTLPESEVRKTGRKATSVKEFRAACNV